MAIAIPPERRPRVCHRFVLGNTATASSHSEYTSSPADCTRRQIVVVLLFLVVVFLLNGG
jgi:hypothetical protein